MATQSNKTPGQKSIGDKIIDILHSVTSSGSTGGEDSNDPISPTIKTLSKESIVGGENRKKKIDDAVSAAGG
jgi:hypothetical protein